MSLPPRRGRTAQYARTRPEPPTVSGCEECCSRTQASTTAGLGTSSLNSDAPLLKDGQGILHIAGTSAGSLQLWWHVYSQLSEHASGLAGHLTASRSARDLPRAHLRALDGKIQIQQQHLKARLRSGTTPPARPAGRSATPPATRSPNKSTPRLLHSGGASALRGGDVGDGA